MTTAEITNQLLALSPAERVALAQKLWESIEREDLALPPESDSEAIALARRRDEALSSGSQAERPHEEVMLHARRSLECK